MNNWNENYFVKFEFNGRCGDRGFSLLGNLIQGEISYQEWLKDELLINVGLQLTDRELQRLLPFLVVSDFDCCVLSKPDYNDKRIIAFRDEMSLTFSASSLDGRPLLQYPMMFVFKEWYNWPTDRLYEYLSTTYFQHKKYKKSLIQGGIFASTTL